MVTATRYITIGCVLAFLSGCVTTNATMLGHGKTYTALVAQDVAIYRTAAQVPGKYEEIALLHSKGDSSFTDEPGMFESMKRKAAEVGANGIILDAVSEPSAGAKIAGAFLGYSAERQGKAIAIYVLPQSVSVPQIGIANPVEPAIEPAGNVKTFLPASTATTPEQTLSERLSDLRDAYDKGLLSPAEYERKRDEMIQAE